MSRKIILTLCLLLVIAVVWSESSTSFDEKKLEEIIAWNFTPDPEMVQRLVGSWDDEHGNSVIFDADGSCRLKRVTDRDYARWKLSKGMSGLHFLSYFRQNGCLPIMKRLDFSFSDDELTLIIKGFDTAEEYLLTRR